MPPDHEDEKNPDVSGTPDVTGNDDDKKKTPTVQEQIAAAVADIKGKLDGAYVARDAALKEAEKLKAKEADAAIKALEADGRHKEAYEATLAQRDAKIAVLEEENLSLSRDNELRLLLAPHAFKTVRASGVAFKEVLSDLTRNKAGAWVDSQGRSMEASVKAFVADPENAFLIKPKSQSGGGTSHDKQTSRSSNDDGKPKSAFASSQDEVLERAAARLQK